MKKIMLVFITLILVSLPIAQQTEAKDASAFNKENSISSMAPPASPPASPKTPIEKNTRMKSISIYKDWITIKTMY